MLFSTISSSILCLSLLVNVSPSTVDDPKPGVEKKSEEKKAVEVTGNWTWTVKRGDQEFTQKLSLKQESDKLSGTIEGRQGNSAEIINGKLEGSEVSFEVKREYNGNTMIVKYKGKLEGDKIKGKSSVERDGKTNERDWEAKRDTTKP